MAGFDVPHNGNAFKNLPNSFTSTMPFLRLPEETHTHIMSYLPVPSMLACSRTCKLLYLRLSSSLALQSIISLYAHSLVPVPTSLSPAHTLALLSEHSLAWQALKPQRVETIHMPPGLWFGWRADLRGGWYAECDEGHVALVKLPSWKDDVSVSETGDAEEDEEKDFQIFRPPGGKVVGRIEDVLIDPGQDLVMYITRTPDRSCLTLHVLTLEGKHHPSATSRTMTYQQTWRGDFPGVKLFACSLSRSLVAFFVLSFLGNTRLNEIVVWNWQTGEEWRRETHWRHYETLAFIGEHELVAGCVTGDGPTLDVYTISSPNQENQDDTHILLSHSLALPRLRDDIRLSVYFSPNRSTPYPTSYPWYCPPKNQLLAITLRPSRVTSRIAENGLYALFLLVRTLLHPPGLETSVHPVDDNDASPVPWSIWGPDNTRIIPLDPLLPNPIRTSFTHGTRGIYLISPTPSNSFQVCVVDFSPYFLRQDHQEDDIVQETELPKNPFWESTVVTRLGYRKAKTFSGWGDVVWTWIDEERLVVVRREDLGVGEEGGRVVGNVLQVMLM
ncbi:hypothetical protein DACRYDRAFT_116652 [Dacryopinax primogenitus]|uniref:F-box domain-containing protein n=1 Tax=Dacryopinax primogenitus (strain DJM 731) TaxID=1858805 RepID=M5GBV4_DACPD|nr:uncharacterized protein DACRYDRAFT_116652 [Dacryopinax primogenitus]EJU01503.1 hypothetical protein DACRYDRAFT_116652 [Dacryopinax primogenitus]